MKKRCDTEESNFKKREGRNLSYGTEATLKLHTKSKPGHSFIALKAVSCPRYSLRSRLNILYFWWGVSSSHWTGLSRTKLLLKYPVQHCLAIEFTFHFMFDKETPAKLITLPLTSGITLKHGLKDHCLGFSAILCWVCKLQTLCLPHLFQACWRTQGDSETTKGHTLN